MQELADSKVEALTQIKHTEQGRVLMEYLTSLLRGDAVDLVRADPQDSGQVGRVQGALVRTQMLLHTLGAEYDPVDEE